MSDIAQNPQSHVSTTSAHILYAMHVLAPFTFWTLALIAVVIGAIGRDNVRGTWVETHYSWLARTFGYGLIWVVLLTFLFVLSIVGIFLLFIPWGVLTIWYLYRVIRGWLRLSDRLPMPM